MTDSQVRHKFADVHGLRLFYREAGNSRSSITLVLLHGFPSSSYVFRNVIEPFAETGERVVAPDMPGFGLSSLPPREQEFTFSWVADVIEEFLDQLHVANKILYLHDFGAAVACHLATRSPSTIRGLIVQNGNTHDEGLGSAWDDTRQYWHEPTEENRNRITPWLNYEGTKGQYLWGLSDELAELVSPEVGELDWLAISREYGIEKQWELFTDYRSHVGRFGEISDYLHTHKPPTLVVWGSRDVFFDVAEVLAYQRDLPDVESHILNAGHHVLETHSRECVGLMKPFIQRIYADAIRSY